MQDKINVSIGVRVKQHADKTIATFTFGDGKTATRDFPAGYTRDQVSAWVLDSLNKN